MYVIDLLDLIMNISQDLENKKASITGPTNISNAIPLHIMVIQQEEMHTQTEVQV